MFLMWCVVGCLSKDESSLIFSLLSYNAHIRVHPLPKTPNSAAQKLPSISWYRVQVAQLHVRGEL